MNRVIALGAGLCCAWPALASAQQTPPPSESAQGVLVFPASSFAGASPNTALDMLGRLPGFALDIGNTDTRGLAGAAGNVLIDGERPSSKSDTLDQVLRRISAASVERIELIRGGAPGIDMQGRAVIANIVLRRTAKTEIVIEPNFYAYPDGFVGPLLKGQYSRRDGDNQTELAFSATTDRTENTAHGSRQRYDANGLPIQNAALDLRDHYRNIDLRGSLQRRVAGGKLHVNALLDYNYFQNDQTTSILSGSGSNEVVGDRTRYPNGELGLDWTRPLGPRSELELIALQRLNYTDYAANTASGGQTSRFASTATGGESVIRGIYKFRPDKSWSFEAGGEFAYNFLKSDTDYARNGVAVPLPNAAVLVSEMRGEGFAQTTWHPSAKLTFEAGLRVELSRIAQSGDTNNAKSFTYPKPRFQLTWLPSRGNQVRFRVEKEVGQLDFGDFAASTEIALGTVAGGNPDLRPQRDTIFEAVYERRFWNKGVFELTAQHSEVQDIIDIIPLIGGYDAVGNIGNGRQDFVQARLTLPFDKIGLKNALLTARVSWAQSHVIDPLTRQPRRFRNQEPWGCGISFSQDLKGGRFSYGFSHGCNVDHYNSYRTAEFRTSISEPFVTIYGQWKPSPSLTLRLDWGNVTNLQDQRVRDVYAGPRTTAPLAFSETRSTKRGEYLFFQIRKVL